MAEGADVWGGWEMRFALVSGALTGHFMALNVRAAVYAHSYRMVSFFSS